MSERIRLGIEMGVDPLRMLDVYFSTDDVAVEHDAFTLLSAMLGFMRGVEPAVTVASGTFIGDPERIIDDIDRIADTLRGLKGETAPPSTDDISAIFAALSKIGYVPPPVLPSAWYSLVPKVDADCDGFDDLHATLRKLRPYTPDPGAGDQ